MKSFIVQSHRGGGALAPENTLESFLAAWDAGLVPEADLRTTKDGVIVAFHDADFSRVVKDTDPELQRKSVRDVTFEELAALDVGSWQGKNFAGQRAPGVPEIFALLQNRPDRALYLDIKDVELSALAELARRFGVTEQIILAAPDEQLLRAWKALLPQGETLLWMGGDERTLRQRLDGLRATNFAGITQLQIHVHITSTDGDGERRFQPSLEFLRAVADELSARGILFQTLPWLCAEPAVYRALAQAGSRSFASDYPEIALRILREAERSQPMTLDEALACARETKVLRLGENALPETPRVFREQFGNRPAVVIADAMTFEVAGRRVQEAFEQNRQPLAEPFIFAAPHAEYGAVLELEASLREHEAIPLAVGSGVINDLVKLAAHRVGRPYLCVATAASMDGYTAFGASITHEGSKQTFICPAPVAVVADLRILASAPPEMTASGYADLMAKITAGADWIVADALGVEPIEATAWRIVQGKLRAALDEPQAIAAGAPAAFEHFAEGLMLGGFAMQWMQTSRPASGAEHQFSHLWDMQHHTHNGDAPSHGFKVGIGTLAATALYEYLLQQPLDELDVDACCARWPEYSHLESLARDTLGPELAVLGTRETQAKYISAEELEKQLETLRRVWPDLRARLQAQLLLFSEAEERLRAVGAPFAPEQIGISRARLRQSFSQAALIRRRFTVLDLAQRTGTLDAALSHIFGAEGRWPTVAQS